MATFLPDPCWTEDLKRCPSCGYSLEGLASLVPCPECGHVPPKRAFVVYGVPKGIAGASKAYTTLVVGTCVVFVCLAQFWVLVVIFIGVVALLVFLAVAVVAVGAVVLLGRGKQSGATRFVFVPGGACFEAVTEKLGARAGEGKPIRWTGRETVTIDRVSRVWRRLKIHSASEAGVVLQAGIRCPDEMEAEVIAALNESIRGASPLATGPSGAYPSAHMNPIPARATTTINDSTA